MMKELKLNASVKDFIALKSWILKLCLLIPLITPSVLYAEPFRGENKVLIVESLGPEFPFVRRLISSIESELIKQDPNHQLYVEYLESTRLAKSDQELDAYANYLSARYKNLKFDRVIFRGAQAQAFAQKHSELFPEAFKVGEGQSNRQEQYLNIVSYVFNADLFFKNAIEVVDPKNIVIINGRLNYPGADAHLDLMLSSLKRLNFGGEVISIRPRTMADLILQMERVEENSLIVLSQFSPPNDWAASPQEFVSVLSEMREVPVFVTHETLLLKENGTPTGAAGGKLVSLAGLAKVLTGGDSSLGQSSEDYPELYDGKVLAEWNIPSSRLSPDAVLISDYPLSFWQAYFYEVILAIAGFALLIIYTLVIKAKLGREFQAKEQLLTREANYVELLESKTEELEKRNQVVTALRDSENREHKRIEHVAKVADIAFYDFDFNHHTIRGNSVLYKRCGLENTGNWISIENLTSRMTDEDAIKLGNVIDYCAQLKDGESHTFYINEKVGDTWITNMVTGLVSKTPDQHHFYGASVNVSELLAAKGSKERLIELLNIASASIQLSIYSLDLESNRVTYNNIFAERWGFEPGGEVSFDDVLEKYSAPFKEMFLKAIVSAKQTKVPLEKIFEGKQEPYQNRSYRMVITPQINDKEEVTHLHFTVIEITDLLRARNELAEKNNQLRELITKRSQLFGMVAHELRTPVASISMMADENDAEEWQRGRNDVKRIVRDLLHTIDDMRLLINPDIKRPVRIEGFNIADLDASISNSVASIVASTGLNFTQFNALPLEVKEEVFNADIYRVRIAITNLIKNACLHSSGSNVWMISRIHINNEGDQFLDWMIADDGKGIPLDQIDRLFEVGERGDSKADGTGLGLHITKTWIDEIGGALEYRPRQAGGSEFMIRIPMLLANTEAILGSEEESQQEATDVLPHLKVLMAEDEAVLRMLGQKILQSLVQDVTATENGQAAFDAFDSSYNLVLTDYFMPEMSGVELARNLREQGYTGVIIGVTAATIGEQRQEMLDAGMDMVLPKPLNAAMIKSAIQELVEQGRFDDLIQEIQS